MNLPANISAPWIEGPTPPEPRPHHEFASVFPMLTGEALDALVEDVREHGVREPIVLLDGAILDGRNRYEAARQCGVAYPVVEYTGTDPLAFVVSLNLKRRHLSESQRAAAAAKIARLPKGSNQHTPKEGPQICGTTTAEAAKMMAVSPRSVESARAAQEKGVPDLAAKMDAGKVSPSAAAEVAKLPEETQQTVVDAGPEAVKVAAKVVRESPPARTPEEQKQLQESVIAGVKAAKRSTGRPRNPHYQPDPIYDRVVRLSGLCTSLVEVEGVEETLAWGEIEFSAQRLRKSIRAAHARLGEIIEQMERVDAESQATDVL